MKKVKDIEIDDILVLLRNGNYGLEELKALIDVIEAKLDSPGDFKADVSAMATATALATHDTEVKGVIANIVNKDATPYIQTYPKLASTVTIISGDAVWAEGAWVEIIPPNTITETFWIVGVLWRLSVYHGILELGRGVSGSETEILNVPGISIDELRTSFLSTPIKIDANTRISGRVADDSAFTLDHYVKVIYATGL